MEGLSTPLLVAVVLFLGVVLWRVRPAIGFGRKRGASRAAVREQMARVDAAKTDAERAAALCDAADLLAVRGARGLYQRALRADPGSPAVVGRVVAGLSRRPRVLEGVLWRHLAGAPWKETKDATAASLEALRGLYDGPLRKGVRGRAMARAKEAIEG